MEWLDRVLVVAAQTQRRAEVVNRLVARGVTVHTAVDGEDALRTHAATPVEFVVVELGSVPVDDVLGATPGDHPDRFVRARPGVPVEAVPGTAAAAELVNRVAAYDARAADQCTATFIHPDGERVFETAPGAVAPVDAGAVRVGSAVDPPSWTTDPGVEVVVADRRGAVHGAFAIMERATTAPGGVLELRGPAP